AVAGCVRGHASRSQVSHTCSAGSRPQSACLIQVDGTNIIAWQAILLGHIEKPALSPVAQACVCSYPNTTLLVIAQAENSIISQTIFAGKGLEPSVSKTVQSASVSRDPEMSAPVFIESVDEIV